VTESRVELDAVDDDRVRGLEVDMLEPKVAVPVPDPPLLDPRPEAAGFPLQDPELPAPHGVERVARDEPADERLHLGEVLGHVVPDRLDRARLRCGCRVVEEAVRGAPPAA
jgi:hypothetical protein